jgi:HSP90 family molecular chaperone
MLNSAARVRHHRAAALWRWASSAAGSGGDEHSFQAETKQLLDMVTNSLYTDKEVFVREIISNASDALEKLRYHEANGFTVAAAEPSDGADGDDGDGSNADRLRITITVDKEANTLSIADSGVGMAEDELHSNLGTIARSGSKAFVQGVEEGAGADGGADPASNLIGKFGVGFYSAFMVADKVDVYTRSSLADDAEALRWSSDGLGAYTVARVDAAEAPRGSKVVLHLKDDVKEFSQDGVVERIIKKYSNFVNFPIFIGEGEEAKKVNTVQALWSLEPHTVSEEQHGEFYKFVANAYDDPMYTLHFRSDAPIEIKSLFYIGQTHQEKYGMGRMEPGVSLYSRKVLIEQNSKALLPDWMRFARGVVDSEDIPLNISRESMQDSRLIQRIRKVLTKRFIKFLEKNAKDDAAQYRTFFDEFGHFLKEGICTDYESKDDLAKLLRFATSALPEGELTSLDECVRRPPALFFARLHAPTARPAASSRVPRPVGVLHFFCLFYSFVCSSFLLFVLFFCLFYSFVCRVLTRSAPSLPFDPFPPSATPSIQVHRPLPRGPDRARLPWRAGPRARGVVGVYGDVRGRQDGGPVPPLADRRVCHDEPRRVQRAEADQRGERQPQGWERRHEERRGRELGRREGEGGVGEGDAEGGRALVDGGRRACRVGKGTPRHQVSFLLCTVTFYANLAHSLTRSP